VAVDKTTRFDAALQVGRGYLLRSNMNIQMACSWRFRRFVWSFGAAWLLLSIAAAASAASHQNLPVVKPATSCEQLGSIDLSQAVGAKVTIQSAAMTDTPKGQFCKIAGNIAPEDGFEVDLPLDHWTQRFFEAGCGGGCGIIRATIGSANSCVPALNGEFAVAANDLGHTAAKTYPNGWSSDPAKRLDHAYLGNHQTTLAAKALMKAFYGQGPKFSYFMGCSDGGREALIEAQRYPNDFDGISAGAPVSLFTVQNTIGKRWENLANTRADGSKILLRSRVTLLHQAIVDHCPTLSGVQDGLLEDPRTCKFDPAWVQCKAGETDTAKCLTAEEVGVAQKLYGGAVDNQGRQITIGGFMPGSEPNWTMPTSATGGQTGPPGGGGPNDMVQYMLQFKPVSNDEPMLDGKFPFDEATFNYVARSAPLWGGANTNLRSYLKRGGKLILWQGLADVSVTPWVSIAYYQGVQKEMGENVTDTFMRLFLIPGVSHCGGGEGFQQIDLLTPLMAWTEMKEAPKMLMTGIPANQNRDQGGPGGPGAQAAGGPGGPGGQGGRAPAMPYASAPQATSATRPVFAFPYVAHYTGKGDPKDAANFEPVKTTGPVPQLFDTMSTRLIGPDNQKFYRVENGELVVDPAGR
jgi:Tannase and feruloyl esterase